MDGGGERERALSTQAWSLLAVIEEMTKQSRVRFTVWLVNKRSDIGDETLSSPRFTVWLVNNAVRLAMKRLVHLASRYG